MSVQSPPAERVAELERSFEAFTQISGALESAYDRLRRQAKEIDLALAESNRALSQKVAELDEASGHLKAVLESLQTAVVVTDRQDRIVLVNRAFETLTGLDSAALLGLPKSELFDRRGMPVCSADSGSLPRQLQMTVQQTIFVRSTRSPVTTAAGAHLGEVECLVDETEIEILRHELRRTETLTALGEMAAGIAHEIRNPMNAMEGFAGLLLDTVPKEEKDCREYAERIIRGVRKANAIITNLLCFAQPERFQPQPIPVLSLFRLVSEHFADQENVLSLGLPQPSSLTVHGDPTLLERVLVNLVENAREADPEGPPVEITAEQIGNEARLLVQDRGPGISEEIRERIFLPFVTGRADGTGLGLAIVHRIVDLHRGRIHARPRPQGGTTFELHFPAFEEEAIKPEERELTS